MHKSKVSKPGHCKAPLLDCGFPCETGFVVVATAAYRALETDTTVGSHTGCLQAESVLAWLAACWWAWAMCLRLSQGARK